MDSEIIKRKERRFFSMVFDRLSQVEKVVLSIQEETLIEKELTLLVKLDQSQNNNGQEATERNEQLKTYLKKLLVSNIDYGLFKNPEIGNIFVAGPLSQLFLHDMEGKKLAELSEGPYAIIRGLGMDETEATNLVKKLNEGHYLLLIKHPFNENGFEGE